MLHNFFQSFSHLKKIGILASSESVQKLNKNIYSSRGSHLFKNVYGIKDLVKVRITFVLSACYPNEAFKTWVNL